MPLPQNKLLSLLLYLLCGLLMSLVVFFVFIITLVSVLMTFGELLCSVCLLFILLVPLLIYFSSPSESFVSPPSHDDVERLLQFKPHWQHELDEATWVSMGKFISVGLIPQQSSSLPSTASPLDRLLAFKKQGYWLNSSK